MSDLENKSVEELIALVETLTKEKSNLTAKNKKLRKDCKAFAKRIKTIEDSGILDVDVAALQEENRKLQEQLEALQAFPEEPEEEAPEEDFSEEPVPEEEPEQLPAEPVYEDISSFSEPEEDTAPLPAIPDESQGIWTEQPQEADAWQPEEEFTIPEPKAEKTTRHPKANRIARRTISILLLILILFALISTIFCLFGSKWTKAAPFGYRFTSVCQDYNGANLNSNQVVKVKKTDLDEVQVNDVVASTVTEGRLFGKVVSINNDGSSIVLEVENDNDHYQVTQDNYIGVAKKSINGLGAWVRYASNHTYNYFGYQISLALFLVGLLLLIPVPKKVRVKEIDQDAFTI